MSANTRGVVNPDVFSAATVTPAAAIPTFDRASLAPVIARQWWQGTMPAAGQAAAAIPAQNVTPGVPPAPRGDCDCA